jgi:autotransporter-associated beta strand protein
LLLSGTNAYTGNTTISGGLLLVNGSLNSGSAVTVNGGTLGGGGIIGGATTVNANGVLYSGVGGIGILTFSNSLALNAASTNRFVMTTVGGVSNSVAVGGLLSPNGSVIEINTAGGQLAVGTYTNLFTYGSTNGTGFAAPVFDTAQTGTTATITNDGAGHVNLVISTAVVISSDASLSYLALSPAGTLSPAFSSGTTNYTANEANANSTVTVTVTNASAYATNVLFYNGTPQATNAGSLVASVPLVVGSGNVIQVVVTAQDGVTTSTNTVDVTRLASSNALLSNLVITQPGTLYPTPFSSGTTSYNATNTYVNKSVTVTATSADGTAALALTFNGTPAGSLTSATPSGNQTLVLPTNTVVVTVVSQDLSQTNTYTVDVLLQPSQTVAKLTNSVSGNNLVLSWPADHLGYRLLTQTNNLNKGVSGNINDWGTVAGSQSITSTNIAIIKAGVTNAYYKLVYP